MTNYISRAEVEELCGALLHAYAGKDSPVPQRVDIDGFVQDYLHCIVLYESFAEDDPSKLGFIGDGVSRLKIWQQGQAVDRVPPVGTIVLEKYLLRSDEHTRRRFTLAHEAGHYIAMRLSPDTPACFYHSYDASQEYSVDDLRQRCSIHEWQANAFAAGLLMPVSVMQQTLQRFHGGRPVPVYGNTVFHPREKLLLQRMAAALAVSHTALVIRLRELHMLENHDLTLYIQEQLQFGGAPL